MVSAVERFEEIRKADHEKTKKAMKASASSEQMQQSYAIFSSTKNEILERINLKKSINEPLDGFGIAPLLWACTVGDIDIISRILSSGFYLKINDVTPQGYSALHCTVSGLAMNKSEILKVSKMLLEAGIDANLRTNDWISSNCSTASASECGGKTALHIAAENGNTSLCRIIHQYGGEILSWDNSGLLPEDYSSLFGNSKCTAFLQSVRQRLHPNYPVRGCSSTILTKEIVSEYTKARILFQQMSNKKRMDREIKATIEREYDWNDILSGNIKEILDDNFLYASHYYRSTKDSSKLNATLTPLHESSDIYKLSIFKESFTNRLKNAMEKLQLYVENHPFIKINLAANNSLYLVGFQKLLEKLQEHLQPYIHVLFPDLDIEEKGFLTLNASFKKLTKENPHTNKCDALVHYYIKSNENDSGMKFIYKDQKTFDDDANLSFPDAKNDSVLWFKPMEGNCVIQSGSKLHGSIDFDSDCWVIEISCHAASQFCYPWKQLRESYLSSNSNVEFIDLLKEFVKLNPKSTDLCSQDNAGYTLLHFAVLSSDVEAAQFLLENNIDPYVYDRNGFVALHYAIANDDELMVECLLPYYHDVDVTTLFSKSTRLVQIYTSGQTPLHLACQRKPPAIGCAKLLLQNGANKFVKDSTGHMPLLSALE